jgi:hypothetical protein
MGDETPVDPLDAGLRLARSFEAHSVPYALGGALAFGVWAIPRATVDVDVNVFVTDDKLGAVFDALGSLGIAVDHGSARSASTARGMFALKWGRWRIDVFTPSIPFSWEAARTRSTHVIDGQAAIFLSAEALAVFKLLFFRPKDIVDLQRLIAVQGPRLDRAYIRAELIKMMGDDDPRVLKWDELVAAAP